MISNFIKIILKEMNLGQKDVILEHKFANKHVNLLIDKITFISCSKKIMYSEKQFNFKIIKN
jgi:hypothetical protein